MKVKLKVGDRVRIRKEKSIFDKGDVSTWSKEIYQITSKNRPYIQTEKSEHKEEVKRAYHPEELSQTFSEPPRKVAVAKKAVWSKAKVEA